MWLTGFIAQVLRVGGFPDTRFSVKLCVPQCLRGGIASKTIYHRDTEIAQRTTEQVSDKAQARRLQQGLKLRLLIAPAGQSQIYPSNEFFRSLASPQTK